MQKKIQAMNNITSTATLFAGRLVGVVILCCVPAFLEQSSNGAGRLEPVSLSVLIPSAEGKTSTVKCQIGNKEMLIKSTECPSLNTGAVRFYSQESARECTSNIRTKRQQMGLDFSTPPQGTGYCDVDLGAEKIPQAYHVFLSHLYSEEEIKAANTPEEYQALFSKIIERAEGEQIPEEKWKEIQKDLKSFQDRCEQYGDQGPGFSCHARDFSSIRSVAELFQGRSSDGNLKLAMKFKHGPVGAFSTSEGIDIDQKPITIEHIILDYDKPLDLEGLVYTDKSFPPNKNRGRTTFDTHSAKHINLKNSELTGVTIGIKNLDSIDLEGATLKTYVSPPPDRRSKYVKIGGYREDDGRGEFEYSNMKVKGKANFKEVTAHSMTMEKVDFEGEVDFQEGKASGMSMEEVTFGGKVDFRSAKINGIRMNEEVGFIYNNKKVNFTKAEMVGADLRDLNAGQVYEPGTHPKKFNFTEANLTKADLRDGQFYDEAIFKKAKLVSAKLDGAKLFKADFTSADLRFATLIGTDLREADFTKADLRYTDVKYADLRGATFRGADIRGMKNLDKAKLTGADFTGAKCWPEQYLMLQTENAGECDLQGGCRYIGSPTVIDIKPEHIRTCGRGYCYAVVRCVDKDIPETTFRAFCPTQDDGGRCPSPRECAEVDLPEEYVKYVGKEQEQAGGGDVDAVEGESGDAKGAGAVR